MMLYYPVQVKLLRDLLTHKITTQKYNKPKIIIYLSKTKGPIPHWIGGNRERRFLNNFTFSIAKINVFGCQNRFNGNRKRLI